MGKKELAKTSIMDKNHFVKGGPLKYSIHRADSRGHARHGWLNSYHSFSFASYYNPERMGFGLLRVLNDDEIAPGTGFGTHPHNDMEIISIPISGALRHKDSQGNAAVISHGEVQLMSAGRGVLHSEHNNSQSEIANFLQIWIMPEKIGIEPRYDQKKFSLEDRHNQLQTVVSPIGSADDGVKINQQAYFTLSDLDAGKTMDYKIHRQENGCYVFIFSGKLDVAGEILSSRDAIAIEETNEISFQAKETSSLLIIDVPMK